MLVEKGVGVISILVFRERSTRHLGGFGERERERDGKGKGKKGKKGQVATTTTMVVVAVTLSLVSLGFSCCFFFSLLLPPYS